MNNEELILERLDRLERRIAPLTESARSIGELREDLAPRVNEAVQAMIMQLADVESDFQLEDLIFLIKKVMRNVNNFSFALEQFKNLIDFAMTAEPLLKSTVPQMIFFLDEMEQKRVFKMARMAVETLEKIGETYTDEDLEQISEGAVKLMGIAKKLTAPQAVDLLDKAADLPANVDLSLARPTGPFGMLWAMGNHDVKQGFGVLIELTKGLSALTSQDADA